MPQRIGLAALAASSLWSSLALSDATFTFQLGEEDETKTEISIAVARYFARIEEVGETPDYLLYQAGKFFPLYEVNPVAKSYTQLSKPVKSFLTPPHEQPVREKTPTADTQNATGSATDAQPAGTATSTGKPPAVANADSTQAPTLAATAGPPQLKASRKSDKVAGIACRVILEMLHGKPVMEHCMANAARLKVTKREVITLARTFTMARARQLGWLGIGSKDEEFVSIRSRDLRDNRTLELKSVSIAPLPAGYLRIPREYKQLEN